MKTSTLAPNTEAVIAWWCSVKIDLQNLVQFTGKHRKTYRSLFLFSTSFKVAPFLVNFPKFLRTYFYRTRAAASVRTCEMKIFLSSSSPDSYKVILLEENIGPFFSFCVTFSSITPFHVTTLFITLGKHQNFFLFRFQVLQKDFLIFPKGIERGQ